MNERLPYEEQLSKQLDELKLPDENLSWEDMKRRLDEDNDDGVIVPPVLKGCRGYGLLFLLLATILFFLIRPDKWSAKETPGATSEKKDSSKMENTIDGREIKDSTKNSKQPEPLAEILFDSTSNQKKTGIYKDSLIIARRKKLAQKEDQITSAKEDLKTQLKKLQNTTVNRDKKTPQKNKTITEGVVQSSISNGELYSISAIENNIDKIKNDTSSIPGNHSNNDTSIRKYQDSDIVKKNLKDTNTVRVSKQDSIPKKQIYFAAGAGLQQLLPVNGQKFVPYNSLGRKGTLADYIPSIYFRMYKDKKWFVQSEFRYGAPQYNKELLYAQQKLVDTNANSTLSTSSRLKKTYYNQLPVSFNYFILPGFSIGTGLTWNKFSSAVIDREVKVTNNVTMQDSVRVNTILRSKKPDSNFVTSYFQALFETQYEWKRFSIGVRYSFGLEPYIKFELPGGQKQEEKNSSLQLFIKYNLWESKKK